MGAAAQTPCGTDDLSGEEIFDGADGSESVPETGTEGVVFFPFFRVDAVVGGEEAEFDGVAGGGLLALGGARAG